MKFETPLDLVRAGTKKIVFPRIRNPGPHVNLTEALRNGTVGMNLDAAVQSITEEEDQRILTGLHQLDKIVGGDDG